ncbi:beta-glucuronidase [Exaiptasia diaphana]|uniref:Beta-glucuronidase n=1 Tax=Exaiptasia diaphana TaxID=2652724 RepID=A0A913WSS9_EXADI|nr:beta-glucuronidase [Exaiptasia diaphana]
MTSLSAPNQYPAANWRRRRIRVSKIGVQGMLRVKDSETREVKDLCGLWNFRADMSNDREAGFRESWFSKPLSKSGTTIPMPVPSSYNDVTQDRTLRDFIGWVWYDREFFVPHSWNDLNKTRVVLRFESAHYYSIVWVNGKKVVEHEGGHLPFEVEITTDLAYNKVNWITAAVNNTLTPTTLPPGTIEYLTGGDGYPPGYFVQKYKFDFFNYAGIHRPVKLYTTSIAYLSDITITTSYDQTSQLAVVQFDCQVGAPDTVPENEITMKYDLLDKDNYVVATDSGADMFKGQFTIKNPILWWPVGMSNITAYLYTLKVSALITVLFIE